MDVSIRSQAEELVGKIAKEAKTAEDVNELMRVMMKATSERVLNTEMDVHLGRRDATADREGSSRLVRTSVFSGRGRVKSA